MIGSIPPRPPGSRPYADWLEEWSGRSLRGLIVGAVPLVSLQYITGASRPGESSCRLALEAVPG